MAFYIQDEQRANSDMRRPEEVDMAFYMRDEQRKNIDTKENRIVMKTSMITFQDMENEK